MGEIQLKICFAAICILLFTAACLYNRNEHIKERQARRKKRRELQLKYNNTRRLNECIRRAELLPPQKYEKKQTVIVKGCFAGKAEAMD